MHRTGQDIIEAEHKLQTAKLNWELQDDGEAFTTPSSLLQPVTYKGIKAMLKIPFDMEERRGAALMVCWDGRGSAKILLYSEDALLMERAVGTASLKQMVMDGDEDKANRILCAVAAKLHSAGCRHVPELVPLTAWFSALKPAAGKYGGILGKCDEIASGLLSRPVEELALHGDIHYENILDSGTRGWIAIDPKGLFGERAFDFANIFCNPDFKTATSPARLSKQLRLIAAEAKLDPKRLLKWIIAWAGLSASWTLDDGEDAALQLTVASIAVNELANF